MAQVISLGLPGATALANAVAGYGSNKSAANYQQAQMLNLEEDNRRQNEQLQLQRDQAALALKRFEWEQNNHRLSEDRAAAKFPLEQQQLQLGNQQAGVDLAAATTAKQLEDTRIASLFPTADTLTDTVVSNVEKKMPEFDIGAFLQQGGSGLPQPSNLPGAAEYDTGLDTGGYGSTSGMDSIGERDQYRQDVRDRVGQLATNEVLANKDLDAAKWIEDQTKAFSGGGGYRPATLEEKAAFGVDPKAPLMMTPDGKPDMIAGTTKPAPQVGTIPAGYELITDQQTGASRLQPIAGSEADLKAKQAEATAVAGGQARAVANDVITRGLDNGIKILDQDSMLNPATGAGTLLANWVPGSNAVNFTEALKPVNAQNAFSQLQSIRDSSPTGGGLGAISEKELALLEGARASLSNAQSEDQLRENMNYLWNLTQDAIHGVGQGPTRREVDGKAWSSPMAAFQRPPAGGAPTSPAPAGAPEMPAANAPPAAQTAFPTPTSAAISHLQSDPSSEARQEFDDTFGPGAAGLILGGQ